MLTPKPTGSASGHLHRRGSSELHKYRELDEGKYHRMAAAMESEV